MSKEIKNCEQEQQQHRFEQWSGVFSGERERERERNGWWKNKWRARGPHTMPWRDLAWPIPPCGVVAWWVPLVVLGASLPHFRHKNLKTFFWNFSRNFIFEDF
jgi:hypothetical protein